MIHYIYKTSSPSGKFYIGRHSTDNLNDNYIGSGKWVRQIKDKSSLTVEILEIANTFEELVILEEKYIAQYIDHPNNMNFNNRSVGWASGELSWAHTEESKQLKRELRSGKTFEEIYGAETAKIAKEKMREKAKQRPSRSPWNKGLTKETSASVNNISASNKGQVPWNKGVSTGLQTFTGKHHTNESIQKMKETQRLNRANNRITCAYCGKHLDKANYVKYHGEKCKSKSAHLPSRLS